MRRRNFLASAGSLAGIGFAQGVVGEHSTDGGMSLKEAGLKEEYDELMQQGRVDEAKSLLERGNVEHASGTQDISAPKGGKSDEIRTHQWFDEDESEVGVNLTLEDSSEDIYDAWGYVFLSGRTAEIPDYDAELAKDGAALTFNSDLWRAVEPTQDGVDYNDDHTCHDFNHQEFNINEGVAASVDIDWQSAYNQPPCKDVCLTMKTPVERTEEDAELVQFAYEHTGAILTDSVQVGLCYGALCVQTGYNSTTLWKEEATARI